MTEALIGQVLDGRYKIEKVLGEGGMGIVYKAVHTMLGKPLAIKVLRPEVSKNEEIVQRFRQEAQSASQIGHPHIVDISDFGTLADGSTYFAMEFLTGRSLTLALTETQFTTERTIRVVSQIADALGAAHEIGIVHRDLKPDNVQLIDRGGQKDFVKVLDFGIAKVGGSTSKLTQAGQVFGTPHYMSPEQCAGTNVDHRTDIYAVGVILYELMTGRVPFDADNLMGILTKHLYEAPIPPRELSPPAAVEPAMQAVILKCLHKKPEQRYQSMAELAADLGAIARGSAPRAAVERLTGPQTLTGVEARVSIGTGRIEIRKNRTPLFVGLGTALLALIGSVAYLLRDKPEDTQLTPQKPAQEQVAVAQAEAPAAAQQQPPSAAPVSSRPPPPVAPVGLAPTMITVRSSPEHAEVYKDGARLGNAPIELPKPERGKDVKLELRLAGYDSKQITISSATGASIGVTLATAAPERPARAEVKPAASPAKPRPKRPSGEDRKASSGKGRSQTEVLDPWN